MAAPALFSSQGITHELRSDFARDVRDGLTRIGQKELPSKYLYDELGSALFEAICLLPEYGLNRAGGRLMRTCAEALVRRLPSPVLVAELGSGNGANTRWLLEALARREPVRYFPIDISPLALSRCSQELGQINSVNVVGLERSYLDGLLEVAAQRRPGQSLLVLFLGSTIGNFDGSAGEAFLAQVRRILDPGDVLLLATDLEKPLMQLLRAYDDPTGVTAAFNVNLLARINRQLDADFDLAGFRHVVRWNGQEQSIEMHLLSQAAQRVKIPGAGCEVAFERFETIWTESSRKYNPAEIAALARRTGFSCQAQWIDREWPFAHNLLVAAPNS
jgi:L-histidine Nalpha-methyltransferase